jgi:predicted DCC family thiol-disulfide oxidoreductase YuxK
MVHVVDLPSHLRDTLEGRDLILFDGECVLCLGFFRTMVRLDRAERFSFATAQSPLGSALYGAPGLPVSEFETNLVIVDGVIHQRLDAFAAAMAAAGWPWRALAAVRFVPRPLRDALYHRIARNRYAIFGRYDACMIPDPHLSARFIDRAGHAA